jgi:hypothetical protein
MPSADANIPDKLEVMPLKLSYIQSSFSGGLNLQVDPTNIQTSEYAMLINARNRAGVLEAVKNPISDTTLPPGDKLQALYSVGEVILIFIDGKAYYKLLDIDEDGGWVEVAGFQMSPTAETLWAVAIPASTVNYKRIDNKGELDITTRVTSTPRCFLVQDGVNQPYVILPDGTARVTASYAEWSNDPAGVREYVPIGKQMLFNDSILYIVAPDGIDIYRSVSGRPLDFMVVVSPDANKLVDESAGNAAAISHRVDYEPITAIHPLANDEGGFIVFTKNAGHLVFPNEEKLVFGEPTFSNVSAIDSGAVNQFSFSNSLLGDSAWIDVDGIRSFNAVLQLKNEGRNSVFSRSVNPLLDGIIQDVCCVGSFDNYALFALKTTYGYGILVYDTLSQRFVSLDLLGIGPVKQFATAKVSNAQRLFAITSDGALHELYSSKASSYAQASLTTGDWISGVPTIDQKLQGLKLVFLDVFEPIDIDVIAIVDSKRDAYLRRHIPTEASGVTFPVMFPVIADNVKTVSGVSFDLSRSMQGWKFGFIISWVGSAKLSNLLAQSIPQLNFNSFSGGQSGVNELKGNQKAVVGSKNILYPDTVIREDDEFESAISIPACVPVIREYENVEFSAFLSGELGVPSYLLGVEFFGSFLHGELLPHVFADTITFGGSIDSGLLLYAIVDEEAEEIIDFGGSFHEGELLDNTVLEEFEEEIDFGGSVHTGTLFDTVVSADNTSEDVSFGGSSHGGTLANVSVSANDGEETVYFGGTIHSGALV